MTYALSTSSAPLAAMRHPIDIVSMADVSQRLSDMAKAVGLSGIYEPLIAFAEGGRLELESLLGALEPITAPPLSHQARATMRAYLHPRRPLAATLIVEGAALGAEVPLKQGAWCIIEAGAITVYVPHGLPETIGVAALERRLGEIVAIAGIEPMDYLIDASEVAAGDTAEKPGFDMLRAPVPMIRI